MTVIPIINQDTSQIWKKINDKLEEPKIQRRLILVIVCVALLLDNMLYMVIVPIIPDYLRQIGAWDTHREGGTYSTEYRNVTSNGTLTNVTIRHFSGWKTVYEGEDSAVGILFASKAIIQLFINPFSGALIDRIGYDIPMMIGLTIMFFSTAVFACGQSYGILFFARSLQGVGSAFADTGGLAMIADRFTEESERSKALGIALAFISFGCLVAPPFGGLLYEFAGKEVPFIVLSLVCLVDGILLLFVMRPVKQAMKSDGAERPKGTPIWRLFIDPYIAIASGALMMSNVSLAFLEPTISIWMEDNMNVEEWQMGLIWLPAFFPHVIGVYFTVRLSKFYPRYQWLLAALGLALEGLCSLIVPFASSFWILIIPISGICFGIAMVDTSLLPTLGYLVDLRYVSVYGSIYAIADISYSLAYAIGPIIAGSIVQNIGFLALNIFIALSNLLYAPLLAALRYVYDYKPFENEANILMSDPPPKQYQTYMLQDGVNSSKPTDLGINMTNHVSHDQVQQQTEFMETSGLSSTNPFRQASFVQSGEGGQRTVTKKHVRSRGYRSADMERIITSSEDEVE
ncbi:vesicular acetylcholine transporter-like isoform X4 [Limulus polyphemus]|uniref:Vesicular acetylcholine transporter-like isoform X4 n=1 Tax=Limulus polyphemus TaxID=6850 RepID=A0ABM1B009_LIMPO|nr:vesicular acetylcholine transporter-like isoform X4 [Limulus polyphemus]